MNYPPTLLPQAVTVWLHWEAVQARIANPYLTEDEGMEVAVEKLRRQFPYIRGTLRAADGRIVGKIELPQMRLDGGRATA